MLDQGLPNQIRKFIDEYIISVEQLEILILISRNPEKDFTVESVYTVILSSMASVEAWLNRFSEADLVKPIPARAKVYHFNSANALSPVIDELARTYKAMPVRVIEAIYNKERPRGNRGLDPAQGFANSFRLRKG